MKPTNPQLFLHFKSNHPRSCFKAIVYGQALTVKMICSREDDVKKHMKILHEKFLERGYPEQLVIENLSRGARLERADLLKPKPIYPHQAIPVPAASKRQFRATFIVTFNPHNPPLKQWLHEAQICLETDRKMSSIYPKPPSVVTRQAPSLKRILTSSRFKQLPFRGCEDISDLPAGCFRHGGRGHTGCRLCGRLKQGKKFRSTFTGLEYTIRFRLTCKSKFVCYLVTCTQCGKQYTGSTTQFMHTRHVGHGVEVREESTPLGRHFAEHGLNSMQIQIIDCVQEGRPDALEALRCLEGAWQHRLATFDIHGNINSRDELTANRQQQNQQPMLRFAQRMLGV